MFKIHQWAPFVISKGLSLILILTDLSTMSLLILHLPLRPLTLMTMYFPIFPLLCFYFSALYTFL